MLGLPKDPDRPVSFEQFVDLLELQDPLVMDRHWQPQHINLMHPLVTYDFIGRLDNFERDLAVVREATGMPPVAAPAVNTKASRHGERVRRAARPRSPRAWPSTPRTWNCSATDEDGHRSTAIGIGYLSS